jgi:hypothetical protein
VIEGVTEGVHYPAIDLVADGAHRVTDVGVVVEQDPAGEIATGVVSADEQRSARHAVRPSLG